MIACAGQGFLEYVGGLSWGSNTLLFLKCGIQGVIVIRGSTIYVSPPEDNRLFTLLIMRYFSHDSAVPKGFHCRYTHVDNKLRGICWSTSTECHRVWLLGWQHSPSAQREEPCQLLESPRQSRVRRLPNDPRSAPGHKTAC